MLPSSWLSGACSIETPASPKAMTRALACHRADSFLVRPRSESLGCPVPSRDRAVYWLPLDFSIDPNRRSSSRSQRTLSSATAFCAPDPRLLLGARLPGGPGDDRRLCQITVPVQSGNSGAPVLDMAGNAVGVVVVKLNPLRFAKVTGDLPQNVNFGIGAGTAHQFLDAHNVPYETAPSTDHLSTADVAAKARAFTVVVECWI